MELSEAEKKLFGTAQVMGDRTPNFRHGKYLLMLDTWKLHRGYRNVLSDVHTFVVLKSSPLTVVTDKEITETPNEVGSKAGATFKYDGPGAEMAPINSTRFLLALWGITEAEISADERVAAWLRATNEDPRKYSGQVMEGSGTPIPAVNPCRGMLITMETAPVLTRKTQTWITALNWSHVARPGYGENSYEAAAKRWAEYEAKLRA